jgi:hypothetical protein
VLAAILQQLMDSVGEAILQQLMDSVGGDTAAIDGQCWRRYFSN